MFVDIHNNLRKKCMSNMKRRYTAAAAMMMVMGLCASASAAFDENLNSYTLDTMVVEADAVKNKFGDTITEQSYYRTGGDVKVITREEIEKRHYTDISEAIKRVPGVSFQNPGFRGGEYGFGSQYNNGVTINGDTRVIILVDGRRVDNTASARVSSTSTSGGKGTGVILDQVTNMTAVDKIEVIKGPGASVYGPDAVGGVINIITRKGSVKNIGSVDLATGSWSKHNYAFSYSGSAGEDNSWHYFVSANRERSGNTKYKDGTTGVVGTLPGSRWKEEGVNIRLDKDFNEKQNLKIWYNYKSGEDGYPVTAPSTKYWNKPEWQRIMFNYIVGKLDENNKVASANKVSGESNIHGWRTIYNNRALYGCQNEFRNNDLDITYTFDKENGMESFVRLYNQNHRYTGRGMQQFSVFGGGSGCGFNNYSSLFPNGATDEQLQKWMDENLAPFPGTADANTVKNWVSKYGDPNKVGSIDIEKNRGMELQFAKTVGVNDIIAAVTYDKAKHTAISTRNNTTQYLKRDSIIGYVQDKIHVSDKFDITPAIRYSYFKSINTDMTDRSGNKVAYNDKGNVSTVTPALNAEYMFDETSSLYAGWTKICRPLRPGDYSLVDGVFKTPLEDEDGSAYTFGFRKEFSPKTSLGVHYDYTNMSNAIATLPIWSDEANDWKSTAVNAKQTKKSFNITLDHKVDSHFTVSTAYAHSKDEWKAKNGWILDPNWDYKNSDDINTAINSLSPQNHYSLNLSYENKKLYTGLLANWYTGCNTNAFSDNRFLILDWNLNYEIRKDLSAYVAVTNITNEGYETIYKARNGIGAGAMPARCFMVGMKYTF